MFSTCGSEKSHYIIHTIYITYIRYIIYMINALYIYIFSFELFLLFNVWHGLLPTIYMQSRSSLYHLLKPILHLLRSTSYRRGPISRRELAGGHTLRPQSLKKCIRSFQETALSSRGTQAAP